MDRVVDSPQAALRLSRRPAYAAQLTPDEWGWTNVKHDGVAPAAPHGPEQRKTVITARLRRWQRLPHLIRSFFGDPELTYTTTVT